MAFPYLRVIGDTIAGTPIQMVDGERHVATVFHGAPNREALAHLLAAAPDLLAAVKRFAAVAVSDDDTDREEFDAAEAQVLAAIAKAEGR